MCPRPDFDGPGVARQVESKDGSFVNGDREPLFERRGDYRINWRNPWGRFLGIVCIVGAIGFLFYDGAGTH
jgi:hypothetical protein